MTNFDTLHDGRIFENIRELRLAQKSYFEKGNTLTYDFRINQLKKLLSAIKERESDLQRALYEDLHKSPLESYSTEIAMVIHELKYTIRHLKKWMRTTRVSTPLFMFPGKSRVHHDPLGNVLIICPFNYPVQLTLAPLISAIAGGNTAVVQTPSVCQSTSKIFIEIINSTYIPKYIFAAQSRQKPIIDATKEPFDLIFFTGSPASAKKIMADASANLTPLILELGGKSPVILDENYDIDDFAKKVAWGRYLNAGQTCIAPDYALVPRNLICDVSEAVKKYILEFFGPSPELSEDLGRIISDEAFVRITNMISDEKSLGHTVIGGDSDRESRYIEPSIILTDSWNSPSMQAEIFGPVLPIIPYDDLNGAIDFVRKNEKPLACYIFSKSDAFIRSVTCSLRYGGGCVNDVVMHVCNNRMPFGGIGNSGMGKYHGKTGFEAFTHSKSIFYRGAFTLPVQYPPYTSKSDAIIRKII